MRPIRSNVAIYRFDYLTMLADILLTDEDVNAIATVFHFLDHATVPALTPQANRRPGTGAAPQVAAAGAALVAQQVILMRSSRDQIAARGYLPAGSSAKSDDRQ